MAHIIVVGNEKGGAGKSTVSMHVATSVARMGHSIGVIDLDLRQKTLTRYLENRLTYMQKHDIDLAVPEFRDLPDVEKSELAEGENIYDRRHNK